MLVFLQCLLRRDCLTLIQQLVPKDSAVFGLPGERENQVKINADHSDVCRFDPALELNQDNYILVEANLRRLCESAIAQGELSGNTNQ